MDGKRFIRTLRLENLLSYGSPGEEIALEPLNVLIGPNASGKSNLIEAIGLLHAAPKDMAALIRAGGGVSEWLWKGGTDIQVAEIETTVEHPEEPLFFLHYRVGFTAVGQRLEIISESITSEFPPDNETDSHFSYHYRRGDGAIFDLKNYTRPNGMLMTENQHSWNKKLNTEQSILAQVRDPIQYRELTYLVDQFSDIRLYRWDMGRKTELRKPQPADLPIDFLEQDASNLGLVLNDLEYQGIKPLIVKQLKKFHEMVGDIVIRVYGSTTQIYFQEERLNRLIPAAHFSDGTLRYLCLLAVLCHPSPPPMVCIEEPELGLHPDILPVIAELLVQASQRTQLVVTTHSDILVSALPAEAVVVCERDEAGSHLRRLDPDKLKKWLEEYTLGELWQMGELGGTRW